jgi:glycosyltransferase involved in cell wall biosynthesis
MRITHITVARRLTHGQIKQMQFEVGAAKTLDDTAWSVVAYQSAKPEQEGIRRIPFMFRGLFLRHLFAWMICLKYSQDCDYVLLRYIGFDPFGPFLSPLIRNRGSVHHSKEVEELLLIRKDWRGAAASLLERWTGGMILRRSVLIVGVTREIALYEVARTGKNLPVTILPNGIDASQIDILADERNESTITAAFVCGSFNPWHGLDLLVEAARGAVQEAPELNLRIHLIGSLSRAQREEIEAESQLRKIFICHGTLVGSAMTVVLQKCDVGIGSLAMHRQNLTEGATLKVREMLASGLPVFSGHIDTALPEGFPFYQSYERIEIGRLLTFAQEMRRFSRSDVRKAALPFIERSGFMKEVVRVLGELG